MTIGKQGFSFACTITTIYRALVRRQIKYLGTVFMDNIGKRMNIRIVLVQRIVVKIWYVEKLPFIGFELAPQCSRGVGI